MKYLIFVLLIGCYSIQEPIKLVNTIELDGCDKCDIHIDDKIYIVYNRHFEREITGVKEIKVYAYGNWYPDINVNYNMQNERLHLTGKSIVTIKLTNGIEWSVR